MTQDDVIRMAREAKLPAFNYPDLISDFEWQTINHFVELVAAHERKACAQLAEEWLGPSKDREIHIAKAIRARGEQA